MKKLPNQKPRLAYGWAPDLPDNRDHQYAAPMAKLRALPAKADLRNLCPPVYNQGQIGSCTANAIAATLEFDRKKQKLADFIPSRLFIYYNERSMEHSVPLDSGAQTWGAKWGQKGYFTIPYAYLLTENLSDDFWTI